MDKPDLEYLATDLVQTGEADADLFADSTVADLEDWFRRSDELLAALRGESGE